MKLVKIIKYAVTIIILSSLQVSLCQIIEIGGIYPDMLLPFVISVSVISGPVTGATVGLFSGIFMDSLCNGTSILYTVTYMYTGVICGIVNMNYLRKNAGVTVMFTLIFSVVCEEFLHFIHFTIWGASGLFSGLLYPIFPKALYSTVLSVPIFYFTKKLFGEKKNNGRDYI